MKYSIIPIFIPHYGCPHQCIFCNQQKITGVQTPVTAQEISSIIDKHLSLINKPRHIEIAFYGGSFTALPLETQHALLAPANKALNSGKIHAIRLSTRPDCINSEIINLVSNLGVSTIELGAQSIDDTVLRLAARGHTSRVIADAVELIKSAKIKCGLQLMIGLPGENWSRLIKTTFKAAKIRPDFARIYPTLVIADTPLARLYNMGLYQPLSIDEAISRSVFMKLVFQRNNIPVIRTGLQASEDLSDPQVVLAGPYHPAFGEMVDAFLFNIMVTRCLESLSKIRTDITIHHHPKDTSKVRGVNSSNIRAWKKYFTHNILLIADGLKRGQLDIEASGLRYVTTSTML